MVERNVERQLLEDALDALDDLYDQRERAEWWTERLLLATGTALAGTDWGPPMLNAARVLRELRLGGADPEVLNHRALGATGDLRLLLAAAL